MYHPETGGGRENTLHKYYLFIILIAIFSLSACGQSNNDAHDKAEIISTLHRQANDWNSGDLEKFMVGYWENDSLMFVGGGGVVYGYTGTLERYKKAYDTPEKMGKLSFEVVELKKITTGAWLMVGRYHLSRTIGDARGIFTLVWKMQKGKWVIMSDHSE